MKGNGDSVRGIGRRKGDVWDRFDRLQRNMLAFSRGKGKRRTVQYFRTYQDLSGGRDHKGSDQPSIPHAGQWPKGF
jgi:hypothetical protein